MNFRGTQSFSPLYLGNYIFLLFHKFYGHCFLGNVLLSFWWLLYNYLVKGHNQMYIMPTFEIWLICTGFSTLYGGRTIKHRAESSRRGPEGSSKWLCLTMYRNPVRMGKKNVIPREQWQATKALSSVFSCTESPLWLIACELLDKKRTLNRKLCCCNFASFLRLNTLYFLLSYSQVTSLPEIQVLWKYKTYSMVLSGKESQY